MRPATINWLNTALAAAVSLALQVGTNYANDYSDGVRGTDEVRAGPFRLTASRHVAAAHVRRAALIAYAVAAGVGALLAARSSWWLIVIGASAILAGWFYTGGPRPYGYIGLGELFVMVYFGGVATLGTQFVQHRTLSTSGWWLAVAVGAAACQLLEANNLRDIDGDRAAGKKTLASRLGRRRSVSLVVLFAVVAAAGAGLGTHWYAAVIVAVIYIPVLSLANSARAGRELLPMLSAAARAQLILGATLVATLWLTR